MMKTVALVRTLAMAIFLVANQASIAGQRMPIAELGDVITMTANNPDGRLCPVVACAQGAHISRIPAGTRLHVLRVYILKLPMYDIPWYEVHYGGKKGWVGEMSTDRAPEGIGSDFCPRNPKGIFSGCDD